MAEPSDKWVDLPEWYAAETFLGARFWVKWQTLAILVMANADLVQICGSMLGKRSWSHSLLLLRGASLGQVSCMSRLAGKTTSKLKSAHHLLYMPLMSCGHASHRCAHVCWLLFLLSLAIGGFGFFEYVKEVLALYNKVSNHYRGREQRALHC